MNKKYSVMQYATSLPDSGISKQDVQDMRNTLFDLAEMMLLVGKEVQKGLSTESRRKQSRNRHLSVIFEHLAASYRAISVTWKRSTKSW